MKTHTLEAGQFNFRLAAFVIVKHWPSFERRFLKMLLSPSRNAQGVKSKLVYRKCERFLVFTALLSLKLKLRIY